MLDLEFRIPPLDFDLKIDTERMLDDAAAALLESNLKRFLSQLSPEGDTWIPSRASLIRKARGIPGGTLYDTGRLFRSIAISTPEEGSRAVGTDVPYAAKHQFGLDGMLKREFLGVSDGDFVAVQGIINDRLGDYLK